ncbi:MAG: ABC transporter permease [Anaerolineaceae bacterium]|nr:ABC transporter permease [Anaerolineaceae bacterium]
MGLYLRMAWRNIWRHRSRTFIIILSIGLTMALMMFFDGFYAGFENSLYTNAIRIMGGNIQINAEGYHSGTDNNPLLPLGNEEQIIETIMQQPHVVTATRRIITSGLVTNREGSFPVNIIGVEPDKEIQISLAAQNAVYDRYLKAEDEDIIFIGKGLAEAMDLEPGDRITLVGRANHNQMRTRTMTIADFYDVGMPEIEKSMVYISLKEAQELYGLRDAATEISISVEKLGQEAKLIKALSPLLPDYEINSWQARYPELSDAISSESGIMDMISIVILFIAGIGILNLLSMAVFERTREIGILSAMGLKPRQVSLLFLLEGTMIGLIGLIAGLVLGLTLNIIFSKVGIYYGDYSIMAEYMALMPDRVYNSMGLEEIWFRTISVIITSILAAFVPARDAARNDPAESLHYV